MALKEGNGKELRKLHNNIQQHVRGLKTLECDFPGQFITSMIELKLDVDTFFEWQKHSQSSMNVLPYKECWISLTCEHKHQRPRVLCTRGSLQAESLPLLPKLAFLTIAVSFARPRNIPSIFVPSSSPSLMLKESQHSRLTTYVCFNCLSGGHSRKQCKSIHKCKICQKLHHTLLHINSQAKPSESSESKDVTHVSSNTATRLKSNSLLMTCCVLVIARDGSFVETRALLDNASSASFISERLDQSLLLPRFSQHVQVPGIGCFSQKASIQLISSFQISPFGPNKRRVGVTAVVVLKVTCDLPLAPVPFQLNWKHIADLH